ncbi:MAG: hypothetical protein IH595_06880 [Bacteroidales bacterium]|nr:hypothetical protein [Bacteroidales bacterium]
MKKSFFSLILVFGILLTSCQNRQEKVITKKIQYDVPIKSPNSDYDWWIENISGPQRENLVQMILKGALDGKYQAYDYFYKPITKEKVSQILFDTIHREITDKTPPYELKDTIIINQITWKNIEKLRFMEEWDIDQKDLSFRKKVVGISPVARITDASGNVRWQPLFWIFPDKNYLKKMNQNSDLAP